ncbi:MAG: hypothetical protein LBT82_02095 [Oscillospiraceae bacterium]|jgi:hypothetical protein|nr:hypothetical protein [Oscillospiraceae bacterium]
MKKLIIYSFCISLLCLTTTVVITSLKNNKENNAENIFLEPNSTQNSNDVETKNKDPELAESKTEEETSSTYIIKDYNGKVAVFEKGKQNPFRITNCQISQLPVCDQDVLKTGIEAKTESELVRVLEDYCS